MTEKTNPENTLPENTDNPDQEAPDKERPPEGDDNLDMDEAEDAVFPDVAVVKEKAPPDTTSMYILWALSAFLPLFGIIFAYIKSSSARDEFEKSHCSYAIRTFWWGLLWSVIAAILAVFLIGIPLFFAVVVWYVYRIVKGVVRTSEGKPVR